MDWEKNSRRKKTIRKNVLKMALIFVIKKCFFFTSWKLSAKPKCNWNFNLKWHEMIFFQVNKIIMKHGLYDLIKRNSLTKHIIHHRIPYSYHISIVTSLITNDNKIKTNSIHKTHYMATCIINQNGVCVYYIGGGCILCLFH